MPVAHRLTSAILLLACACQARADWISLGAAYSCKQSNSFELQATMATSNESDPGTVKAKPGFKQVKPDQTEKVRCKVGQSIVTAEIRVSSPRERGMCAGSGSVSIEKLAVNNSNLLPADEPFNVACTSGTAVVSVKVQSKKSGRSIEVCRGEWEWGVGYGNLQCKVTETTNPSLQRTASGGR